MRNGADSKGSGSKNNAKKSYFASRFLSIYSIAIVALALISMLVYLFISVPANSPSSIQYGSAILHASSFVAPLSCSISLAIANPTPQHGTEDLLTANVKIENTNIAGATVNFTSSSNSVTINPEYSNTNSSGEALSYATSASGGNAVITATFGTCSARANVNFLTESILTELAQPSDAGNISPGSGTYPYGQPLIIGTNPNPGFVFIGWTGSGTGSYTGNDMSATITPEGSVSEIADYQPSYLLTTIASPGKGGTVSPASGIFTTGSGVLIQAYPTPGYVFSNWKGLGSGSYGGINAQQSILMDSNIVETAVFVSGNLGPAGNAKGGNGLYLQAKTDNKTGNVNLNAGPLNPPNSTTNCQGYGGGGGGALFLAYNTINQGGSFSSSGGNCGAAKGGSGINLTDIYSKPSPPIPVAGSNFPTCQNNSQGGPCTGNVFYTQNTTLTNNLNVSNNVTILKGVTLITGGCSILVGNTFTNLGTIYTGGTCPPATNSTGTNGTNPNSNSTVSTNTISIGSDPTSATLDSANGDVYITDSGSGAVTVYNPSTGATSTIPVGNDPTKSVLDTSTGTLYVINSGSGTVTPINTTSGVAGAPIPVGTEPTNLVIDQSTGTLYVINSGSGTVTPINANTGTPGTPIPVGSDPKAAVISPNGTLYVINSGSNTVTPINTATNTAGTPIPVGSNPTSATIAPSTGVLYVTNSGSNSVTAYNPSTGTTVTIPVGSNPTTAVLDASSGTLYVINSGSGTVTPINTSTGTAGTPIPVGSNPTSATIDPSTGVLYVTNSGSNSVTAYNPSTGTTVTIPVGSNPTALTLDTSTGTLYVVNSGSNSLTSINTKTIKFPPKSQGTNNNGSAPGASGICYANSYGGSGGGGSGSSTPGGNGGCTKAPGGAGGSGGNPPGTTSPGSPGGSPTPPSNINSTYITNCYANTMNNCLRGAPGGAPGSNSTNHTHVITNSSGPGYGYVSWSNPGTYSFATPSGTSTSTVYDVSVMGAGGAGGQGYSGCCAATGGTGGGGGAYANYQISGVSPGSSATVGVGSGGSPYVNGPEIYPSGGGFQWSPDYVASQSGSPTYISFPGTAFFAGGGGGGAGNGDSGFPACAYYIPVGAGGTYYIEGSTSNVNFVQGADGQSGSPLQCVTLGQSGASVGEQNGNFASPGGGNGGNSGWNTFSSSSGAGGAAGLSYGAWGSSGSAVGGAGGGAASPSIAEYKQGTSAYCHQHGCLDMGGYGAQGWAAISWGSQGSLPTLITESSNSGYGTAQQSGVYAPSADYEDIYYPSGSSVTISAEAVSGYVFTGWSCTGPGCYSGNSQTATITMGSGTITETANFAAAPEILTVTDGSGTGTYPYGSSVTISAPYYTTITTPTTCSSSGGSYPCDTTTNEYFSQWTCTGPGCYSGYNNVTSFTIYGSTTETANYYPFTASSGGFSEG